MNLIAIKICQSPKFVNDQAYFCMRPYPLNFSVECRCRCSTLLRHNQIFCKRITYILNLFIACILNQLIAYILIPFIAHILIPKGSSGLCIEKIHSLMFLDASTQLYKRACPSVGPSVRRSVGRNAFFSISRLWEKMDEND